MGPNDAELAAMLLAHGRQMAGEFRTTSMQGFNRRTGTLGRAFKENLVIQNGDVVGISFKLPRYGYILNHGVKSQSVKGKSGSYTTKGFEGTKYIHQVLDGHMGAIADKVAQLTGKQVEEKIRF